MEKPYKLSVVVVFKSYLSRTYVCLPCMEIEIEPRTIFWGDGEYNEEGGSEGDEESEDEEREEFVAVCERREAEGNRQDPLPERQRVGEGIRVEGGGGEHERGEYWNIFRLVASAFLVSILLGALGDKPICSCLLIEGQQGEKPCSRFMKMENCFSLNLAHEAALCQLSTFSPFFLKCFGWSLIPCAVFFILPELCCPHYGTVFFWISFFVCLLFFITSFTSGPSELCPNTTMTLFVVVVVTLFILVGVSLHYIEFPRDEVPPTMDIHDIKRSCFFVGCGVVGFVVWLIYKIVEGKKDPPLCESLVDECWNNCSVLQDFE